MHHFIFSQKDTYISNDEDFRLKNFAADPYLDLSAVSTLSRTYRTASLITTDGYELINRYVNNFNGYFTGSIECGTGHVTGSIMCCVPGIDEAFLIDMFEILLVTDAGDFLTSPIFVN